MRFNAIAATNFIYSFLKKLSNMKTLSLFLCLFLVVLGFINALFLSRFVEGSIIMNIGGLSLLIISSKTKKIEGYDRKHWMNK